MRFLLLLAATLAVALGLGAFTAGWALEHSAALGTEKVGPWLANPLSGSVDADPYSKARLARIGTLTLGVGEGVVFRADRDSAGQLLQRQCHYLLEGQTPPARVWTLAAFTPNGRLIQSGDGRAGWLVSRAIMRGDDNSVSISVGPLAMPGNWLAITGNGPFELSLTLYDTPASSSSGLGDIAMPGLVRSFCV